MQHNPWARVIHSRHALREFSCHKSRKRSRLIAHMAAPRASPCLQAPEIRSVVGEAMVTADDAARAALYAYAVRKLDARSASPSPAEPVQASGGADAQRPEAPPAEEGAGPAAAQPPAAASAQPSPWESGAAWLRMAQNLQLYLECASFPPPRAFPNPLVASEVGCFATH